MKGKLTRPERKSGSLTVRDPHVAVFNGIAPFYRMFFRYQTKYFKKILPVILSDRSETGIVLDIGCGSGALPVLMYTGGFHVVGIDAAPRMVQYSNAHAVPGKLMFCIADGASLLPFRDKSFDIVISTYVLHGISAEKRRNLMRESRRLSRGSVYFYDYYRRNILTDFVEWMEGGDYRRFVAEGKHEMEEIFTSIKLIPTGGSMAWYVCTP